MAVLEDIPFFGALILAAFGGLFCAFGWQAIQEVRNFRKRGKRHTATVVSVVTVSHGEGRKSYQPTLAFTDSAGNDVRKPTIVGSSNYNFEVGSQHDVLDRIGAHSVVLADKRTSDAFSYTLLVAGLLCLVFGLGGMVY